jgi:hypothetical protein
VLLLVKNTTTMGEASSSHGRPIGLFALGGMLACRMVGGWTLRRTSSVGVRLLGVVVLASLLLCCPGGRTPPLQECVVTTLFMALGVISHLRSTQSKPGRGSKWIGSRTLELPAHRRGRKPIGRKFQFWAQNPTIGYQ